MTQKNKRLRNVRNGILSVLTALAGDICLITVITKSLVYTS